MFIKFGSSFRPAVNFGSNVHGQSSFVAAMTAHENLDTFEKQETAKKSIRLNPPEWAALEKAQKEGRLADAAVIIRTGRAK